MEIMIWLTGASNEIGPRECVLPWDVIDGALPILIGVCVLRRGQLSGALPACKR